MLIDFFRDSNRTECSNAIFGLCDDSTEGKTRPAYIDENDSSKWIAVIKNMESLLLAFYPIDGCISWLRADGTESGKCDGVLCYDSNRNLFFIELKNRTLRNKSWRTDARNQLKETLSYFVEHYDESNYNKIEAYICNKRQLKEQRHSQFCNNFKIDTGFHLHVSREIEIKQI